MSQSGAVVRAGRVPRVVAGAVLLVLALSLALAGIAAPAVADDDAAGEAEPIEIEASTLYVSPATDALPPTVTRQIPPEAVCVVRPELCPEASEPFRYAIRDTIGVVLDNSRDLPVQPVPPDSAAVSFFGGSTRYQTAIKFDAPQVPEGEEPVSVVLTLPQGQPSYDLNSPLYRGIFLAAFQMIGSGNDPQVFVEEFARELQESPVIDTSAVIGVEACPLLQPFEPGGAPQASEEAELPTREEDGKPVPDVDCFSGSSGVFDESTGTWSFDLTFAAANWASGEYENHGVLLRPTGAPNLAFGDSDTSSMAQVVLGLDEAEMSVTTAEAFDPGDFGLDDGAGAGGDTDGFGDDGLGEESFDADAPALGDESLGGFDDAPLDADGFDAALGDVPAADDPLAADGPEAAAPEVALDSQAARPAAAGPVTPWWVWLVVPLLAGGAYLTGSALLAPAPAASAGGGGALTRMLARQGALGAGGPDPI